MRRELLCSAFLRLALRLCVKTGLALPRWAHLWLRGFALELVLPVSAHGRGVRIHFGAEVAEADEGLGLAGVLDGDTGLGTVFGAEVFVLGQLGEADELGAVEGLAVDPAG